MSVYLGYDVLEVEPNGREGREDRLERRLRTVENPTGADHQDSPWPAPAPLRPFLWTCRSRAEIASVLAFIDARRGRLVPFWLPALEKDFTVVVNPLVGATQLRVTEFGYTENFFPLGGARRHVFIWNTTHTTFNYRKVITAVNNGDGTETLGLDTPLTINAQTFWTFGFLRLVRLEDDVPEIEWMNRDLAEVTLALRELPGEIPS